MRSSSNLRTGRRPRLRSLSGLCPSAVVDDRGHGSSIRCLPLCANLSTTSGSTETFVGPEIVSDDWFGWAITIANGGSRSVALYVHRLSPDPMVERHFTPGGDMLSSANAVARVAPLAIADTAVPAVFVTDVRVYDQAQPSQQLSWVVWNSVPDGRAWTLPGFSNVIAGFAWELGSPVVLACPEADRRIRNVLSAFWGRPRGLWSSGPAPNPGCDADRATVLAAVRGRCLNQTQCTVEATVDEFTVDPCAWQKKWAAIVVECETSATSVPPIPSSTSALPISPSSSALKISSTTSALPISSSTPALPISSSTSALPISSSSWALPISSSTSALPISSSITTSASIGSGRMAAPETSSSASNSTPNAWRLSVSLGVGTISVGEEARQSLLSMFVTDATQALEQPPYRIGLVEFADQTPLSTRLRFVLMPSPADTDATQLLGQFTSQIQVRNSQLRQAALLIWTNEPPSTLQIDGVRVRACPNHQFVLESSSCPELESVALANTSTSLPVLTVVLFLVALLLIVVSGFLFCYYRRHRTPSSHKVSAGLSNTFQLTLVGISTSTQQTDMRMLGRVPVATELLSAVAIVNAENDPVARLGTGFAPPPEPPTTVNTHMNKARIERLQYGARDKFGHGAHTVVSDVASLS